ncbi:glycosyltransferase [Paenibacillus sp. Y412MC10]|uniref:glycosyltransferase n=1 Tax=Geobacillus sp. (strain Y412MC10) TaxID=481743 RepID=UPI0011AB73FB|nr:glycosyltransferase [Paenibacillus sp. Y412MC10]
MVAQNQPSISVVIPTYNRALLLEATLEALRKSRLPHGISFEVIVCDDGSSDETFEVIKRAVNYLDLRYFYQPHKGFRAGLARNMGARLAKSDIILFLDSDVLVAPNLIEQHLCLHADHMKTIVIGITHNCDDLEDGSKSLDYLHKLDQCSWESIIKRAYLTDRRVPILKSVEFQLQNMTAPWTLCWSNQFSVRKKFVLEAGGFDESFEGWGYEDLDLAYRLFKSGHKFKIAMNTVTLHLPHPKVQRTVATVVENIRRIYEKDLTIKTELLNCFGTLDYSNSIDKFLKLVQYKLTPDYESLWNDELKQEIRSNTAGLTYIMGCEDPWLPVWLDAKWVSHPDVQKVHRLKTVCPWIEIKCGLGVLTSRQSKTVDTVLITDFWRILHSEALIKMITEAQRISKQILLIETPEFDLPSSDLLTDLVSEDLSGFLKQKGFTTKLIINGSSSNVYKVTDN